jgi:hypothetical protein
VPPVIHELRSEVRGEVLVTRDARPLDRAHRRPEIVAGRTQA